MDRADKKGEVFTSGPVIPKLAPIQRKVSVEVGCADWDRFGAMSGSGSMATWWAQRGLGGANLAHPSSARAEVLGAGPTLALMEAYKNWRAQSAAP